MSNSFDELSWLLMPRHLTVFRGMLIAIEWHSHLSWSTNSTPTSPMFVLYPKRHERLHVLPPQISCFNNLIILHINYYHGFLFKLVEREKQSFEGNCIIRYAGPTMNLLITLSKFMFYMRFIDLTCSYNKIYLISLTLQIMQVTFTVIICLVIYFIIYCVPS